MSTSPILNGNRMRSNGRPLPRYWFVFVALSLMLHAVVIREARHSVWMPALGTSHKNLQARLIPPPAAQMPAAVLAPRVDDAPPPVRRVGPPTRRAASASGQRSVATAMRAQSTVAANVPERGPAAAPTDTATASGVLPHGADISYVPIVDRGLRLIVEPGTRMRFAYSFDGMRYRATQSWASEVAHRESHSTGRLESFGIAPEESTDGSKTLRFRWPNELADSARFDATDGVQDPISSWMQLAIVIGQWDAANGAELPLTENDDYRLPSALAGSKINPLRIPIVENNLRREFEITIRARQRIEIGGRDYEVLNVQFSPPAEDNELGDDFWLARELSWLPVQVRHNFRAKKLPLLMRADTISIVP